jgi:hypothetical protein
MNLKIQLMTIDLLQNIPHKYKQVMIKLLKLSKGYINNEYNQ